MDEKKPIAIPRSEPEKQKEPPPAEQKDAEKKPASEPAKKADETDEMSEEDKKLKETLELLVTRVQEENGQLQRNAMEALRGEIRSSTTSMTSIPKPLKFLRPWYDTLKQFYSTMAAENKALMADILSVLAMTMAKEDTRECLHFRLQGTKEELGAWGHQYVRTIAGEVAEEWKKRVEASEKENAPDTLQTDDLLALVDEIVPFHMKHNAEYEAVDLLTEIDLLDKIEPLVTSDQHARVCRYILSCADYVGADPDEQSSLLRSAFRIFFKHNQLADALRMGIKLDDEGCIEECFQQAYQLNDRPMLSQLGFVLAAMRLPAPKCVKAKEDEALLQIIGNVHLNSYFLKLASDLDVKEAKSPEDIFKSHLVEGYSQKRAKDGSAVTNAAVDSAKHNLASTIVSALVNCGFGKDTLLTPEGSDWIHKNRDSAMLTATAALGMIMLWDVETGFSVIDKYSALANLHVRAGYLLANGVVQSGVTSDMDAAMALLSENVAHENVAVRVASIFGLGLAYAGTCRQDVLEMLTIVIVQENQPIEVVAFACLTLGLVFCGSGDADVCTDILEGIINRSQNAADLRDDSFRLMCLGFGLVFLGKGDSIEAAADAIKVLEPASMRQYLELVLESCAYVGSGSVIQLQKCLHALYEHLEDDDKEPWKCMFQEVAVLGVAMISMNEELSQDMALRALDHVLQYGEVNIRRAVPLALGLLSISNPRLMVMDTLSKLSHDGDERVSQNAVLALGLLGAGTNNSRIANLLRQLVAYYNKDANALFVVRIAQGLLHLGKGLMTLAPMQANGLLFSRVAVAGLLVLLHAALDIRVVVNRRAYMFMGLACSVRPRMLVTLDENLKSLPLSVRVGQAVDVAGQAGNPKTITGFQTHTTPVLLAAGERAELADDKYVPLSTVLEGFVIVKKNPAAPADK